MSPFYGIAVIDGRHHVYRTTDGIEREYLACERCGEFTAVTPARLDEVRDLVERTFGYRARFSHFPIVGLCKKCAAE